MHNTANHRNDHSFKFTMAWRDAVHALPRSVLTPTEKQLLLYLADHVDPKKGYECWMTQATLAQRCSMSKPCVKGVLKKLADVGALIILTGADRTAPSSKRSNHYKLASLATLVSLREGGAKRDNVLANSNESLPPQKGYASTPNNILNRDSSFSKTFRKSFTHRFEYDFEALAECNVAAENFLNSLTPSALKGGGGAVIVHNKDPSGTAPSERGGEILPPPDSLTTTTGRKGTSRKADTSTQSEPWLQPDLFGKGVSDEAVGV